MQQTRETHALEWVMGFERPGRSMDWEDMISETRPDRDAMIADLRETPLFRAVGVKTECDACSATPSGIDGIPRRGNDVSLPSLSDT